MKGLFDQIMQEGASAIHRLIDQRQQENVELEFKTKSNQTNGELTKDDRRNLGVILSAFANSMGGLVIWGVLAAKNGDDIDCATEPKPISEIEKFKGEVERALSQAIMPRHEDIRVAAVPDDRDSAGYLLIQAERSERRPHRCEYGDKQYFKRVGDSSIAMEHYDIEDSFKRMSVPKLSAHYELSDGGTNSTPGGPFKILDIKISLTNKSLMTATYPYFIFDRIDYQAVPSLPKPKNYIGNANDVIHPTLSVGVTRVYHCVPTDQIGGGSRFHTKSVTIEFHCGCFNAQPTKGKFFITPEEIMDGLRL